MYVLLILLIQYLLIKVNLAVSKPEKMSGGNGQAAEEVVNSCNKLISEKILMLPTGIESSDTSTQTKDPTKRSVPLSSHPDFSHNLTAERR